MMTLAERKSCLTLEQAAEWANCSVVTLRRRIWEGSLRAARIGPTTRSPIRIDPYELERSSAPAVVRAMTEPVTLAELKTPGRRVRAVESVLQGLQLLGGAGEVELISNWPLSEPSRTWLERMCSAVCDPELSARSRQELRELSTAIWRVWRERSGSCSNGS